MTVWRVLALILAVIAVILVLAAPSGIDARVPFVMLGAAILCLCIEGGPRIG